jgi:hypothetical protein
MRGPIVPPIAEATRQLMTPAPAAPAVSMGMVGLANRASNRTRPSVGSDHVVAGSRKTDQTLRFGGRYLRRHLFICRSLGLVRSCHWCRAERDGGGYRHDTDRHRRRLNLPDIDGRERRRFTPISFCDRLRRDQHDPPGVHGDRRRYFRDHFRLARLLRPTNVTAFQLGWWVFVAIITVGLVPSSRSFDRGGAQAKCREYKSATPLPQSFYPTCQACMARFLIGEAGDGNGPAHRQTTRAHSPVQPLQCTFIRVAL